QKLTQVRPATLAQAGRVSGVTPAAIQLLAMTVKKQKKVAAALNLS
ncbi:MAG: tRNA uridine 5-carboxymethylaminomethyl modification enzyme, partial [Psychrobacter okhotskensis]